MPLTQAEYEEFLTRAGLVMGLDKTPATRQQWKVFTDDLYQHQIKRSVRSSPLYKCQLREA